MLIIGLLLAPSTAGAGTISISFDLSGSSVSLPNGVEIPPDGSIQPGAMLVLHLQGDVAPDEASGTVLPGAGVLDELAVAADVNAQTPIDALFTGDLSVAQLSPASGDLAVDLTSYLLDSIIIELIVFIDCAGSDCGEFGGFPLDIETVELLPSQPLTLAAINTPGAATIAGALAIEIGGVSFGVDLQGVEASRAFVVPEPSTGLLLLLGLAMLRVRRPR